MGLYAATGTSTLRCWRANTLLSPFCVCSILSPLFSSFMHSSRGGLSLPSDPGADLGSYHNEDQENTPNEGRAPQQPAVKSAARIAPVYEEPPLPDYPAMFPEEDSGRGESRNEFPERGGEAAYDDPTREIAPRLPPPIISRSHSVASQGSLVNSNSVASSSSPSEFDPSKLYLENLPLPISETRLRDLFQQFGTIKRVHIGTDRATKAQLGFGFVDFATDQQGLAAIAAMNQRDVDGRIIRCSQAKRRSTPNAAQSAMVSPAAAARSMGGAAQPGYGGMPGAADQSGGISQQPYVMMMNSAMMGGMGMMSPQQMQMAGAGMMMGGGAMQPMGMGMQPMGYGVGAGGMINSATGMMMMAPGGAAAPAAAALPTATPAPAQPFYGRNDAPPSPNIFINGVPFAYTEADLQTLFEPFGAILSTKILLDMQGKSRGQGFINFKEQASAQASIQAWNAKKPPNGETYLQVRYALPRKGVVGAVGAVAPAASSAAQQQPQMQPMMMMGAGGMPEQQQAQFDPSQQQMMMAGSDLPPGLCGQLPFAPSRVAGSLGVGAGSDSGYGPDRKGRAHLGQKHDPLSRPTPSTAATGASNLSSVYGAPAVAAGAASLAGVPNGPDSTTLFIYHVPQKLTNEELQALFAQHGAVHSVSIPRDANNQGKGFAFAKMATMADAHNVRRGRKHAHGNRRSFE